MDEIMDQLNQVIEERVLELMMKKTLYRQSAFI